MVRDVSNILNGGKKSICIDLKHSDGKKIIEKLAVNYDILLEPFRPGQKNVYSFDISNYIKYLILNLTINIILYIYSIQKEFIITQPSFFENY